MRAIKAKAIVDGRPGTLPSSATCSVTLIVSCRSRSWADFLEGMEFSHSRAFIVWFANLSEVCSAECLRGPLVRQRSQPFSKISSTTLRLIALGDRALLVTRPPIAFADRRTRALASLRHAPLRCERRPPTKGRSATVGRSPVLRSRIVLVCAGFPAAIAP